MALSHGYALPRTDQMELSDANVSKDESFYGVFVENEANDHRGTPKVFTRLNETLSVVKSNQRARFKLFHSATEAERFSMFGQESPVRRIEKNTLSSLSSSSTDASNNFESLKREEMVAFRRLVEGGKLDEVVNAVNSNPRFLVGDGGTPSIIQEGCRYNVIHVAARYNQPEIIRFIMECILSPDFLRSMYGFEHSYLSRSEIISDLYLNTPDKAYNDTPLHIASKFGHVNVVRELVSYDKCLLMRLNKYGESPKDIICARKNKKCYGDILNLLENRYFVPMLKSDDDCFQPTIGKPFLTKTTTLQNESPKAFSPTFEVRAVAGPMKESQAFKFWKEWKSPVRKSLLSPSPKKRSLNKPNKFEVKSFVKAGRDLARKNKVGWAEYWPCLNKMVDIKSDRGLDLLEKYLKQRFGSREEDEPKKLISNEPSTLSRPMGESCKMSECMRNRFSDVLPSMCHVKADPRLKPKQLFLDDESTKNPDGTRSGLGDNVEDSLILTNESVNLSSSNGYDSDEDVYSSAVTSPCSENSSSDNELNEFFNAEPDFPYLLFSRNKPTDDDLDVFDEIRGINTDPNQYPWVFRWLYSMNDYFNVNISNLL